MSDQKVSLRRLAPKEESGRSKLNSVLHKDESSTLLVQDDVDETVDSESCLPARQYCRLLE
jgi:hypothetical protein